MAHGEGLLVVLVGVITSCTSGQPCEPVISDAFPSGVLSGPAYDFLWWEIAGEERLVAGGDFETAGGLPAESIAYFDGGRWHPLGGGFPSGGTEGFGVYALALFDPDGPGPLGDSLIAGGRFSYAGDSEASNLAYWDGAQWHELAGGADGRVWDLYVFDEDGPGPLPSSLYCAGEFFEVGGTPASRIARWDGQQWTALLTNSVGLFERLIGFDEDGPGGNPPALFAAGTVLYSPFGILPVVAKYLNGTWQTPGSANFLSGDRGHDLAVIDPDGNGPLGEWLIVVGSFSPPDGSGARGIAAWDGATWHTEEFDDGRNADRARAAALDDDGPGPRHESLFVTIPGGSPYNQQWYDGEWTAFGFQRPARSLQVIPGWDDAGARLLIQDKYDDKPIWLWNGESFTTLSPNFEAVTIALQLPPSIAPDGEHGFVLLRDGFGDATEVPPAKQPAWWSEGAAREAFQGITGITDALIWDLPGDGSSDPRLIVTGSMAWSDDRLIGPAAWWDGGLWQPLGNELFGRGVSIIVGDPDNSGPIPETLLVTLGPGSNEVLAFIDGAWQPIDEGLMTDTGNRRLLMFDPDGEGPMPPALHLCGRFRLGSNPDVQLAVFDGQAWTAVGEGFSGDWPTGLDMVCFDRDAGGPESPEIWMATNAEMADSTPISGIAIWDGQAWSDSPGQFTGYPERLLVVDGRPLGFGREILVASGPFTEIDGQPVRGLAAFDGQRWYEVLRGADGLAIPFVFDDDDDGPLPPALYFYGDFHEIGGVSSVNFARYGCELAACYADYDGSGSVNTADFIEFLNGWSGGHAQADCNQDGTVDTRDFICFLNAWSAGC